MKTTKLKLGLLAAITIPFLMGCPKSKKAVAPEADTELQSSIDAAFANFVVTDIEMIASFSGENDRFAAFYTPAPGNPGPGTFLVYEPSGEDIVTGYQGKVNCKDGRVREGSVWLRHPQTSDPNARYYRRYNFIGQLTLLDFKVDGWAIETINGTPCYIYNRLSSPAFDPAKTQITWLIDGSFKFTHPTDPSKNMVWTGKLTKTLVNTSDPSVYPPSGSKRSTGQKPL